MQGLNSPSNRKTRKFLDFTSEKDADLCGSCAIDGILEYIDTSDSGERLDFYEIGDFIYDGIYIADGEGKTLYVNDSFLRITGLTRETLIGNRVQDLEAQGVYLNAVTPEVLRQRRPVHSIGESLCNHAKMLITGNPVFGQDGKIKLVVVVEREITDFLTMKMELEAIQKKMKTVERGHIRGKREVEHLREETTSKPLVYTSREMQGVVDAIDQVAGFDTTVLIQGETGVGKEVVANQIHMKSPRKDQAFIKLNCTAIPASLLEAELFGYEKGAFTGASVNGKIGLFELADKGTILLDEIGDMPQELQSKLLRVLQEKEIMRIGGTKPIPLDVRIIAATHRDLETQVKEERFRQDLFYRISIFPIHIPPLRQRSVDLLALAEHFLTRYNTKYRKSVTIGGGGYAIMRSYNWPGNGRELQNIIERLVLISPPDAVLDENTFSPLYSSGKVTPIRDSYRGLKAMVADVERRIIASALADGGSTRKAADLLKVDQSTIVKKAKRLGIALTVKE
ncbi:PAS domain S-box-containing protein [Breoghania corrubedonensis]|uniref:HTH-type transcriptional regulatory protein TyrR n=1 Tax=Breoghania corrubedonensis TaxID=665038 RepID=A0A2T5US92_9HYPH|nr:sigma 54-interacting transcriptional regulator [Breoghania corrubedonensis]PTW54373.1 PAS domain S-box-containing protein [Breoghania corrubedonensis]